MPDTALRIHILSDLHLEVAPWRYVPVPADLIVLAGDISDASPSGDHHRRILFEQIQASGIPAVYVLGNHEGYHAYLPPAELRRHIRSRLPSGITLLERSSLDIHGFRILGCCLWSDFTFLEGLQRRGVPLDRTTAMHAAGCGIADFSFLQCDPLHTDQSGTLTPAIMSTWHEQDRRWLATAIAASDRPIVVVTHFLPGPGSIAGRFVGSILNPYFATDCRDLMRQPVRLWIHGHTHDNCDYQHGPVRVVCNPRGYSMSGDNEGFDGGLVITVTE